MTSLALKLMLVAHKLAFLAHIMMSPAHEGRKYLAQIMANASKISSAQMAKINGSIKNYCCTNCTTQGLKGMWFSHTYIPFRSVG
jgi:hypothetical protein